MKVRIKNKVMKGGVIEVMEGMVMSLREAEVTNKTRVSRLSYYSFYEDL